MIAIALVIGVPTASAAGRTPFRASLVGAFVLGVPCPDSAPAGAECLIDRVAGTGSHLGHVTGEFHVVFFDAADPRPDGCVPIQKRGRMHTANGDEVRIEAKGTYCAATGIARYAYAMTGGTGRLAHVRGHGVWLVPPPTSFDPATGHGSGPEMLEGTVAGLEQRDPDQR